MPPQGTTSSPTRRYPPTASALSLQNLQQDASRRPISPPRTPRASEQRNGRSKAASQRPTIRPVLRETFLEDKTPEDVPQVRDSDFASEDKDVHDLSFSPRHAPRMSMFDNMLQSLDQLSNGPSGARGSVIAPSTAFNENVDIRSRYNTIGPTRRRGHTMSSSVSSENDVRKENMPPATSSSSRIGRSNSNSHFKQSSTKLPAIFGEDEPSTRTRVFLAQRAVHPDERNRIAQPRSGRSSSKSSTSSSIDLGQMMTGSQIRKKRNRRSQSFDYGSNRHNLPLFAAASQLDAAPTPIVHAGPGARHIPISTSTQQPAIARKNSTKSSRSHYGRKDRSGTVGAASTKAGPEYRNTQAPEPMPALPSYASSPTLNSSTTDPRSIKERPGFFRRVFGSSKSAQSLTTMRQESRASQHESGGSQHGDGPDAAESDPTETPQQRTDRADSKDSATLTAKTAKGPAPTVTKKSSAFFRRRKKSTSGTAPLPIPLNLGSLNAEPGQPSPVSSLRQVMDPFLADARRSISSQNETEDVPQGYHTALTSPAAGQDQFGTFEDHESFPKEESQRRPHNTTLPTLQIPSSQSNSGLRVPSSDRNQVSFLADSSSAELSTRSSNASRNSNMDRPKTSPTNLVHDRALKKPELSSRNGSWNNEEPRPPSPVVATATPAVSGTLFSLKSKSGQSSRAPGSPNDAVSPSLSVPRDRPPPSSPHASGSEVSVYRSAPSTPVIDKKAIESLATTQNQQSNAVVPAAEASPAIITEEDREQALRIFENRDEVVEPSNAAAWLGDAGSDRERFRSAYMQLFDWANLNILAAFRGLCDRIALKGESQQVDRILDSFAKRWCDCNTNHGFKSSGEFPRPVDEQGSNANSCRRRSHNMLLHFTTEHRSTSC